MNESQVAKFRSLSDAWQENADTHGPSALALAQWYRALSSLAGAKALEPVDFSSVVSNADKYPPLVRPLIEAAASVFGQIQSLDLSSQSSNPVQWRRDVLAGLVAKCNDDTVKLHPDSKWLMQTAEQWSAAITTLDDQHKSPANIKIEVTPSLSLNEFEETPTQLGYSLLLPVMLFNCGQLTAWDVATKCTLDNTRHLPNADQRFNIPPGKALTARFRRDLLKDSTLNVSATYADISAPMAARTTTWLDIGVKFNQGIEIPKGTPFVPGLPLDHTWFEKRRVFGNHQSIVDQIANELTSAEGKVLEIAGCRRSGKTSIMREIHHRLQKDRPDDLLPIYVDLDNWVHAFDLHDAIIDEESLMYELLHAVLRQLRNVDPTTIATVESTFQEDEINNEKLTRYRFEALFGQLRKDTRRAFVFLLDEFDALLRSEISTENGRQLLAQYLREFAADGKATLILAYDFTSNDLVRKYLGDRSHPQMGIKHLDELDMINLARIDVSDPCEDPTAKYRDPRPYSALALAYIWRITGGWPGLTQVLLHQVFHKRNVSKLGVIDVGRVKAIVRDDLLSSNNPALDDLKSALSDREKSALRCLRNAQAIDPATSYISDVTSREDADWQVSVNSRFLEMENLSRQDFVAAFRALKSKQIIEVVDQSSGTCRLRVGLFYYAPSISSE